MLNSWGLRHALHNFLCPLNRVELSKRERRNLSVKSLALMNIEDSVGKYSVNPSLRRPHQI